MKFSARQALGWLDQAVLFGTGSETFEGVSTDTRTLTAGSLYVPIRGENFDGHQFIAQALDKGARGIMFEAAEQVRDPALWVGDTRHALGEIARGWRSQFTLPLIAVTGSNGKTTVKEMIAAVLREAVGQKACLATEGNFNNDIGVPLTLFRLKQEHQLAVLELGMNHPGEIDWLAQIAQPDIALVNNAQREHQEFLDGVEATAVENGSVFAHLPKDGTAVFPGDTPFTSLWQKIAGDRQCIEFGLSEDGTQYALSARPDAQPTGFDMTILGQVQAVTLQIDGKHNVRNALAAAACCIAAGINPATIAAGLSRFVPASGRMQRAISTGGATLIDDTYNANPDSVLAAIDVLADMPTPRILVLGDMAEVGDQGPQFHREIGEHAKSRGLQALFAIGPQCRDAVAAFGKGAVNFEDVDALSTAVSRVARPGASILVKGSRSMRMERVVQALTEPSQSDPAPEIPDAA